MASSVKNPRSLFSFFLCGSILLYFAFCYYPKWQIDYTEATISWDVSGYYFYLPAIFIYKDLKQLDFKEEILQKYKPTYNLEQAYLHSNGNYVMKYSAGQAILYLPFFTLAHIYALGHPDYPPDGFSRPYQLLISLSSLFYAFLGLWFLRFILLSYFSDQDTALTLFAVAIGSNYLEYSAISGALTHNSLFFLYALVIYHTIRFYEHPKMFRALCLGAIIGLAALTRPTEIIACLLPILWGMNHFRDRLLFFQKHWQQLLLAVMTCLAVGSIQLLYWRYVAGEWIVYSYQDAGFDWWTPHLYEGFWSYKSGWLVYSPLMIFALLGFGMLWKKQRSLFWACGLFSVLFIYLAFAWSIWWYGTSVGQRAMVQAYPVLAFPLAAFIAWIRRYTLGKWLGLAGLGVLVYLNIWLTMQVHRSGSVVYPGQMTKAYFWKVLGKFEANKSDLKLLDTDEEYLGVRKNVTLLLQENFETPDSLNQCGAPPIVGQQSLCLSSKRQYSPIYYGVLQEPKADWIRASALFRCSQKEIDIWKMAQLIIRLYQGETVVKERSFKIHRILTVGETAELYLDISLPKGMAVDKAGIFFWNGENHKTMSIDDLKIEQFQED